MKDVFGREMHSEHRDDMGGVGSWDNCRTLVGGLTTKDNLKKILWKSLVSSVRWRTSIWFIVSWLHSWDIVFVVTHSLPKQPCQVRTWEVMRFLTFDGHTRIRIRLPKRQSNDQIKMPLLQNSRHKVLVIQQLDLSIPQRTTFQHPSVDESVTGMSVRIPIRIDVYGTTNPDRTI